MPIRVEIEGQPPMEFEDGTPPDVIQRTVKRVVGGAAAEPAAAPPPQGPMYGPVQQTEPAPELAAPPPAAPGRPWYASGPRPRLAGALFEGGPARALTEAQRMSVSEPLDVLAQSQSPLALEAARGLQAVNPMMWSSGGEEAIQSRFGPAALRMEEALGSPEAAAIAQFLPQAGTAFVGALKAAPQLAGATWAQLARALPGAVAKSALGNAALGALGAPEGERGAAALAAGTDPLGVALGVPFAMSLPGGARRPATGPTAEPTRTVAPGVLAAAESTANQRMPGLARPVPPAATRPPSNVLGPIPGPPKAGGPAPLPAVEPLQPFEVLSPPPRAKPGVRQGYDAAWAKAADANPLAVPPPEAPGDLTGTTTVLSPRSMEELTGTTTAQRPGASPEHTSTAVLDNVEADPRSLDPAPEPPGGVGPPGVPPAAPPGPPGGGTNRAGVDSNFTAAVVDQVQKQSPRWYQGAMRGLHKLVSLPEQRAAGFELEAIRQWESSQRLQDVVSERVHGVMRSALKKLSPADKAKVEAFTRANLNWREAGGNPAKDLASLPSEVRGLFADAISDMQRKEADLVDAGYFTPEQLSNIQQRLDAGAVWFHREYLASLNKRFRPRAEKLEAAVNALQRSNPDMSVGQASQLLLGFLDHAKATGRSFNEAWKGSPLQQALKGRTNMPPAIRRMLGQIDDPAFVVAHSAGQLEATWRKAQVSKQFTTPQLKGVTWSDTPEPQLWHQAVPNDKLRYGEFAGKYLAPDLFDSVMNAGEMRGPVMQLIQALQSPMKTAKVGLSHVAWLNNIFGNFEAMAGGGLPFWNPRAAPRFKQAVQSIAAWDKQVKPGAGIESWYQKALEDGAIRRGYGAEMSGGNAGRKLVDLYLRKYDSGPVGFILAGRDYIKRGMGKLGNLYDLGDSVPKLAVYIEQVEKAMKAGLSEREARLHATNVVNENFASSAMLGPAQRAVADLGGVVNPFISWQLDYLRTVGNRLNPLSQATAGISGPNMGRGWGRAFNTALYYGIIGGALPVAARWASGLTDDEVAAAQANLPQSLVNNHPILVPVGRDSSGRSQFMSVSPMAPLSMYFRGGENIPPWGKPIHGLLSNMTANSLSEDSIKRLESFVGWNDFGARERRPLEGQRWLDFVAGAGSYVEPGTISSIREQLRRAGTPAVGPPLRPGEEQKTPFQAIMSGASGFRMEPSGPRSAQTARKTGQAAIRAQKRGGEIRKQLREGAIDQEEAKRLRGEMQKRVQEERTQRRRK